MRPEICDAIHKRRLLRFRYAPGLRVIEPYAYGANEAGHELLRGYQIEGESESRERGWKLFRVDEISELTTLDDEFAGPRLGYMRNDPSMTVIYCEI